MQDCTGKERTAEPAQKIPFFEYLIIFIFIVYSGRANSFVEPLAFTQNPVGAFLPVLLCGILILRLKLNFDARFYLVLFGFAIYFLAVSIKFKELHITFFLTYAYFFFLVYVLIKGLGLRLFKIYEHINFYLAIIALGFWAIQIILGGDTFYSLLNKIPGVDQFSIVTGRGYNILIYSVQPVFSSLLYNFTVPRNCGYAWEPGAFAVYLCLAIFINLFFTDDDPKKKVRLWILILALLTTQSTTGYVIFVVTILTYLLNKQLNIIILILPLTVISLVYISSLPFMSKKVINLIDDTKRIDQILEESYGSEVAATPQRFTSLMIALVDFRNNPVLGVGVHTEVTWTYRLGANISTISGIGNLLATFGLVGFLFFIVLTVNSSIFFSKFFNYHSIFLLLFIILFISVSYSIILLPLIMCFWMFRLFAPDNLLAKERDIHEQDALEETTDN